MITVIEKADDGSMSLTKQELPPIREDLVAIIEENQKK